MQHSDCHMNFEELSLHSIRTTEKDEQLRIIGETDDAAAATKSDRRQNTSTAAEGSSAIDPTLTRLIHDVQSPDVDLQLSALTSIRKLLSNVPPCQALITREVAALLTAFLAHDHL
ncbi:hypothetical protein H257_15556 [Aphanomyces astaci]|uniref:Uncharacterized protein n=1 Tax=Aphanomyces astaci TaxID=112090 RepID=W4FPJ9_APHAT|nr:hypothetical protein H257_15556 [Aphanomyces astaci]ETV68578.1 hypothetical protein H257_15556 [Aphanomyces astaci]|eukprot:XP_009842007.1 hypothetical protein H257_15556 [Aphanomyces astaci]